MKLNYSAIAGVFSAWILAGCTQSGIDAESLNAVVYCSESDPFTFNPQLTTSATTADAAAHQIYSRLIDFDPDTGEITPALSSSWLVSDDGLTYTFQLRRGVTFHSSEVFSPTRNFNVEDVLFSLNRWRDANHPFHDVSGGRYPYFESLQLADNIRNVRRVNGYRLEITLEQPDSSFLAHLATDFSVILSAEYAQTLLEKGTPELIDILPIGTGPFRFHDYVKGQVIRYKRYDGYWGRTVSIDNLIYDITPKSELRLAKLITGECDAIALPSQSELSVIREREDLVLEQAPTLNIGFWAFNTQTPPFDNSDVRRALAMAIDKNNLLEAVYLNNASRAKTLVPAASWAFNPDTNDTSYNPVLARKLLDDADIRPGFEMTIWAMPVERSYNPNAKKMAELIQQYLADIQINARIVTYDWNTFRQRLSAGQHDSVLIGWSADNGDPDNFYRPLLSCDAIPSGTNRAMWCNQEYDEMIYAALETANTEQRKQIYERVNQLVYEEQPLVPLAHALRYQAFRDDLDGLKINPFGAIRFASVRKVQ